MIEACRAAVRPRVVSPETGDVVLLEDEVAVWLEGHARTLRIVGGPGSGKTTAIRHLATVYSARNDVILVDDSGSAPENAVTDPRRLIYSAPVDLPTSDDPTLRLASWNDDDLLEYCLARHRPQCPSIMQRIGAMHDVRRLQGVPQLWTLLIDAFAADEAASDWRTVLRNHFTANVPERLRIRVREYCLYTLVDLDTQVLDTLQALSNSGWTPERLPWLRHRAALSLLAAEQAVWSLEKSSKAAFLSTAWPSDLIEEAASRLASAPAAWRRLVEVIAGKHERYHATAATLLHATGKKWQPPPRTQANLTGAVFTGAVWPGIDLLQAMLQKVDFSGADLSAAQLEKVSGQEMNLGGASLAKAQLGRATMRDTQAQGANLSEVNAVGSQWQHANFRGATLTSASFHASDLQHADFTLADLSRSALTDAKLSDGIFDGANCSGVDFRGSVLRRVRFSTTVLTGARFERADLQEANLENLHWPAASLERANLKRAYLTGSVMPGAKMRGAILRAAGLADVDWEDADLRDADFTHCAFHLGSSRSGLVGSPIACEGSRTGFYTDDYLEQDFKSPEEIRKANLRCADLRGAIVDKTDFYLVDLRGARYTTDQAEHFRRCGAILVDRVGRT